MKKDRLTNSANVELSFGKFKMRRMGSFIYVVVYYEVLIVMAMWISCIQQIDKYMIGYAVKLGFWYIALTEP